MLFTSPSHSLLVLSQIPSPPPSSPTSPIPFFHMIERLKTTKREGWRRFGIIDGESIADHMYRMSIITMLAPPYLASKINIAHCTKMALIHDMAESLVGDITPIERMEKAEKHRRESDTMHFLTERLLGQGTGAEDAGKGMLEIWMEYEQGETLEAQFVHDVDKIELLLQMVEYEKRGEGKLNLEEFTRVAKKIELEEVKRWWNEIEDEREDFWAAVKENGDKEEAETNGG